MLIAPSPAEVVPATRDDLSCILAWLKREHAEDGEGFWKNRNLISKGLNRLGELWVIRRNGEAVAFQLGKHEADILSVRKDHRRAGVGKALVQASIERAKRDGVNALSVQCRPQESLGFWERMGFSQYGSTESYDDVHARIFLTRTLDVPMTGATVDVVIGFYPESASYGGGEIVEPFAQRRVTGTCVDDDSIMLPERVVGPSRDVQGCDTVVRIEVGGVALHLGKGKYDEARTVGVEYDANGSTFYIDRVKRTLTQTPSM